MLKRLMLPKTNCHLQNQIFIFKCTYTKTKWKCINNPPLIKIHYNAENPIKKKIKSKTKFYFGFLYLNFSKTFKP